MRRELIKGQRDFLKWVYDTVSEPYLKNQVSGDLSHYHRMLKEVIDENGYVARYVVYKYNSKSRQMQTVRQQFLNELREEYLNKYILSKK